MNIGLCKSCGKPYDGDEVKDGYCLLCQPGAAVVLSMDETEETEAGDGTDSEA